MANTTTITSLEAEINRIQNNAARVGATLTAGERTIISNLKQQIADLTPASAPDYDPATGVGLMAHRLQQSRNK